MLEVSVGGSERELVRLAITSRTRPQETDYWDGNWLNAEVTVRLGGFEGRVHGNLRSEELVSFRDEVAALNRSLSGTATFATMEGWLTLRLKDDGRGGVELEVELMDQPGVGNRLEGSISLDQTHLTPLLRALNDVVGEYPVRGTA